MRPSEPPGVLDPVELEHLSYDLLIERLEATGLRR